MTARPRSGDRPDATNHRYAPSADSEPAHRRPLPAQARSRASVRYAHAPTRARNLRGPAAALRKRYGIARSGPACRTQSDERNSPRPGCGRPLRRPRAGLAPRSTTFMENAMSHATLAPATSVQRKRAGALISSLRGAALATVLLFSAGAQADPAVAAQILQTIRYERQVFDVQMQQVNWYLDHDPNHAQTALIMARVEAVKIDAKLKRLVQENLASRDAGQYNDLQALERAIEYGRTASQRIKFVEVYLQTLEIERPPSAITRQMLNTQILLFNMSMQQLEQAMAQA